MAFLILVSFTHILCLFFRLKSLTCLSKCRRKERKPGWVSVVLVLDPWPKSVTSVGKTNWLFTWKTCNTWDELRGSRKCWGHTQLPEGNGTRKHSSSWRACGSPCSLLPERRRVAQPWPRTVCRDLCPTLRLLLLEPQAPRSCLGPDTEQQVLAQPQWQCRASWLTTQKTGVAGSRPAGPRRAAWCFVTATTTTAAACAQALASLQQEEVGKKREKEKPQPNRLS